MSKEELISLFGISTSIFIIQVYFLLTLIGSNGFACVPGANFTLVNLVYALIVSLLFGLNIIFLFKISRKHKKPQKKQQSINALGFSLGLLTTFCGACTLPFIYAIGLASISELIAHYNHELKIASILILGLNLKQLVNVVREANPQMCSYY